MNITPELSEKIEQTLRAFTTRSEPDLVGTDHPLDLRELAADLNALPMFLDMGGCYVIRPNGEILSFAWDEPNKLDPETNPRVCNVVLFRGAKRYPELVDLMPVRTREAIDCPHCKGTGTDQALKELGVSSDIILCWCGGLGWVPTTDDAE